MKKYVIILIIISLSHVANCQTDYYWYKGKKVDFTIYSNKKYLVLSSTDTAKVFNKIRQSVQRLAFYDYNN